MAGRNRSKVIVPSPKDGLVMPNSAVVASAVRFPGNVARIYHPSQPWQQDCYRHYSICGEARYSANYMGHSVGKATLFTEDEIEGALVRAAPDSTSAVQLRGLFAGPDAEREILTQVGVHLTIGGECYLVGRQASGDLERDRGATAGQDIWEVVGPLEMQVSGSAWEIAYQDGKPNIRLTENDVVIRIWRPHPQRRMEADSPFRSNLPVLSEIEHMTLHIFAQIRSRLAGAGIMWVPDDIDFPPPPEVGGKPQEYANKAQGLMLSLADAMIEPIEDQGSPAAVVPIVVSASSDAIDKVKLMHFWSNLDEQSQAMRQAAINRFALGMDLPPEMLLGMGSNAGTGGGSSNGVSHWGAWQIEESTVRLHVEPILDVFVNAITIGYLRPALRDPSSRSRVYYSTAALRLRPDRSKEALLLYDRGLLKAEVVVEENGFSVTDMPSDEERALWLTMKVASGSATPEQVQAALRMLGVNLPALADPQAEPRESRPDPSLEGMEQRREPERAAALVACESLVFRALERAGNRLRQMGGRPEGVPAFETHTVVAAGQHASQVMEDAFGYADRVLEGVAPVEATLRALDGYVRTLLLEQSPHDRHRLSAWLDRAGVLA